MFICFGCIFSSEAAIATGENSSLTVIRFPANSIFATAIELEKFDQLSRWACSGEAYVIVAIGNTSLDEWQSLALSRARAAIVAQKLLSMGFPPTKVFSEGAGHRQLVAYENAAGGREKNRRVEVEMVLLPNHPAAAPPCPFPKDAP
jgi:outer membrane protein OmpA-like peptidoglycan-associated protein